MNPQGQAGQGGNGRRGRNNGNADAQAGNGGVPGGQNGGGFGGQYGGYGGLGGYGGYGGLGALGGYGGYGGLGGLGGYGGYGAYGWYGGQNGGGGQGNARGPDPAMAERFAAMREAQMELDQGIEEALASILDRGQYRRLKQIQLQAEGIGALLQPEMIEKLNLEEDQVEQIRELFDQGRQVQRENGRAMSDMMRTAFPNPGNNGPNPGGGGPGGPNFRDPAFQDAMKTFMEKPEVKAKMDQMQAQNAKVQDQLAAAVNRVLSKRQAAAYKKMLGAPFDIAQGRGGPGQGAGSRPAGAKPSDRTDAAGKAKASGPDDDEAATSKSTSKSKGPDANAKRKSLRSSAGWKIERPSDSSPDTTPLERFTVALRTRGARHPGPLPGGARTTVLPLCRATPARRERAPSPSARRGERARRASIFTRWDRESGGMPTKTWAWSEPAVGRAGARARAATVRRPSMPTKTWACHPKHRRSRRESVMSGAGRADERASRLPRPCGATQS